MNAIHEFLLAYPLLRTSLDIVSVVVPLSVLLAFAGMGFMSATARILSITRRRSSYDKCARQLAVLGLILGWLLLIGGRIWLFFTQDGYTPDSLPSFLVEMSWMLLGIAVLISSLYYALWKALKNMPVLHVTLGVLSGIQGCVAVVSMAWPPRVFCPPWPTERRRPDPWRSFSARLECAALERPVLYPAAGPGHARRLRRALAAPAAHARRLRAGTTTIP